MLAGLTRAVEARLEFTLTRGNDDNTSIGLGGTSDHVRDIVLMTRSIQHSEALVLGLEVSTTDFDGNTLK